jgi:hypothetical protein
MYILRLLGFQAEGINSVTDEAEYFPGWFNSIAPAQLTIFSANYIPIAGDGQYA